MRGLRPGERVEPGDYIVAWAYNRRIWSDTISRVTATRAYVDLNRKQGKPRNKHREIAFIRRVTSWGWVDRVPRSKWETVKYMVYRPSNLFISDQSQP
jgi:hypothetical protein